VLQNLLSNLFGKLSLFVAFATRIVHRLIPDVIRRLPIYYNVTVPHKPVVPHLINHLGVILLAHLFQVVLQNNYVSLGWHRQIQKLVLHVAQCFFD